MKKMRIWPGKTGRGLLLPQLLGLLLVGALLPAASPAAVRNFSERFSTNATGDIYLIGNTAMTCDPGGTLHPGDCLTGRNGTGPNLDNNYFSMVFVDESGALYNTGVNNTGFSRPTSAVLSMPGGSTVLWAGLYWGGESNSDRPRQQVTFTLPSGASNSITSSVVDGIAGVSGCTNATPCERYGAFADVTNLVKAAGNGTYKVSNIQSWSGDGAGAYGHYAGWGLVVAFSNSALSLKNLTVFDGFLRQTSTTATTMTVSGFLTPLSGPVNTTLGFIAGEGDLSTGLAGDTMTLNGVTLSDPLRPSNNFFTSSISNLGSRFTNKSPNYVDQLGWDVGTVNASNILANGATSTSMAFDTNTEYYFPQAATFATELYVPIVTPNVVKIGYDENGGNLVPGDILRYEISMSNTGLDTATNLMLKDNIPLYTSYVPGTLTIISGPGGAPTGGMSDPAGDDAAEYVAGSGNPADPVNPPQVNFRLGSGANAASGGSLKYGESTKLSFKVKLDNTIPSGTVLTNRAQLSYNGQTLGTVYAAASSAAASAVAVPPTVSKTFTPAVVADWTGTSTLSMVFTNPASNTAAVTGVSVTDTYPAGLINATPANPSLTCTPGSTPGSIVGGLSGGNTIGMSNTTIAQNGSCTLAVTVKIDSNTTGVYTNSLGQVTTTNAGNSPTPSAISTFSVGRPTIAKAFGAASIPSGGSTSLTFTLANPNAASLTGVAFNDVLPSGLTFVAAAASQCNGGTVALSGAPQNTLTLTGGTIGAAPGTCTVTATVTGSTGGSYDNTASGVTSTQTPSAGPVSNTANLLVYAPLTATRNFLAPSISPNGSSVMTVVLSNPNPMGMAAVTGIGFTDSYPTSPGNLLNSATPNVTTSCSVGSSAGTVTATGGGNSLVMSGGSLAAGGSCTISVNVTSATAGSYNDSADSITTTNAGSSATIPAAALNISSLAVPTVTKVFVTPRAPGADSLLTITLANPAGNGATAISLASLAANGIYAMVDNYPTNLVNSATPAAATTCGGTVSATAGGSSLILDGGTIPGSGSRSCTVTVNVTSSTPDTYYNNTGLIYTTNAGIGLGASGSLAVLSPPTITKSFSPNPAAPNTNTTVMTITIGNPATNPINLTGIGFSDTYPTGMTNHSTGPTNTCGGTLTAATGTNTMVLSGATNALAPGATCTVTKRIRTPLTAGPLVNTTDPVTSANAGSGAAATATLAVGNPGVTKTFATSPIFALTGTSVMRITLSNPTTSAMNGAAFTDTFPAGMVVYSTPAASNTCGGTFAPAVNDTSITLTGGTIPSGAPGTCYVQVTVTSSVTGTNTIPVGGVTTTNGGTNETAASATLVVNLPPEITKSFAPVSIPASAGYVAANASTLTVTVTNPTSATMNGVAFTDNYDSPGNRIKNGAAASASCTAGSSSGTVTAALNGSSLKVSGASLLGNGSCTYTIPVYATTAGSYTNHTGTVTTTASGTGPEATADLTVLAPFTGAKTFSPATVNVNDTPTLTVTLTNPNATAISGAAFIDNYPANLLNATPLTVATTCGGTVTATAGGASLALAGGTIPANSSCTVSAVVTPTSSATPKTNPAFTVSSSNDGTATVAASNLVIAALLAPTVTKTFTPDQVTVNSNSLLTITLANPAGNGATAITGAAFDDTYPADLVNVGGVVANTCGGTVTVGAGNPGTLTLGGAGGTIPGNGSRSCVVSINVTSATPGTYVNNSGLVTSTNAATGASAADSLVVSLAAPSASKGFSPTTQAINTPSLLTITLNNANSAAITGANFTDLYPSGMVNSGTPAAATTCGGTLTATAGGNSVALSGGTIPAGGNCQVTVNVVSGGAANYTNTTGVIYSSNALNGAAASGSIDYFAPLPLLTVAKTANPAAVSPGGMITYTIEVKNTGAGAATQIEITDHLSTFTDLFLDAYGSNTIFNFVDGANPSGLPGTATVQFSSDGTNFNYTPTNVGGYDEQIHAFRVIMDGTMGTNTSANPSFQINYQTRVK